MSDRPLTPPPPSQLGTKDYWQKIYSTDTNIYATRPESPTSQGQIWFSESLAEERLTQFLQEDLCLPDSSTFLDLGCGNGHLLFYLRDEGFEEGRMLGVDYVPEAIDLAKKIAANEGREDVEFSVWDCVGGNYEDVLDQEEGQKKEWDVVLDKGTFDAIGLAEDGRQAEQGYLERAKKLVKKDGLVVITSCNWTEEELVEKFTKGGELVVEGKVNYPTFQFGGKQGQTISTIAFKRV